MIPDDRARLDLEIARLRQSLDDAEEMRRAIVNEEVDAFVVGRGDGTNKVVILDLAGTAAASIVDSMPQGAVTVSNEGEILYSNQRFAEMVGRRLAQLFATDLLDLVDPRDRARLQSFVSPGSIDSAIDVRLQPPGSVVHVVAASRSDDYVSLFVTERRGQPDMMDSAEALQAVQEDRIDGFVVGGDRVMLLGEAYRPYQAIVDEMLQGAITASRDGDVVYANERFAAMIGVPRQRIPGAQVYRFFAREDLPALRRIMAAGRLDAPCDLTVIGTGGRLPVQVAVLTDGDMGGITLVLTDLTERRRHRRLEEEGRRKDQFLAVLAHELRNPLAPIRNAVEILERCPDLPQRVRYPVSIIGRQAGTLTRLVDDLIDVQRLNEGKIALKRQPREAAAIVRGAVEAAQPLVDARQHRLELTLPERPVYVDADEVRLTQVLVNVLTNAAKYTQERGHIRLALSVVDQDVPRPLARIEVSDDGVGVTLQDLERMFDPYVQLQSDSGLFGGLGLGLAVARWLVELHGGSIRAHSEGPGLGCVVTLELPTCAAPSTHEAVPVRDERGNIRDRLRILVADDNEDALESMATLLDLMGHQTRIAKDGVEAVEVAEEFRPDLAFLDIGMPRMDGYEAARALRSRSWADSLVLCALTGWGQPEDKHRAHEAGFDSHYVKPLDPRNLETAIRLHRSPDRTR